MDKTKIEWSDSTWSPVTGCQHGCEYCYAHGITNRFCGSAVEKNLSDVAVHDLNCKDDKEKISRNGKYTAAEGVFELVEPVFEPERGMNNPYPFGFAPTFHKYKLNEYAVKKRSRNIFVCSMGDLYGKFIPMEWRREVYAAVDRGPQHNYLFLTKDPRLNDEDREFFLSQPNCWIGTSVTSQKDVVRAAILGASTPDDGERKVNRFLSVEPLLDYIDPVALPLDDISWVVMGAETGKRKSKVVPQLPWVVNLVGACMEKHIPVLMKHSLADVWPIALMDEMPKSLKRKEDGE